MLNLFNVTSDSEQKLSFNTDYANKYDGWRQKEELHKLKSKYGEDVQVPVNSEESSESSQDDDGKEISEQFEKNFYKTLAYLKNKNPKIYDKDVQFFKEPERNRINISEFKQKKEESLFLRDYKRKIIVEGGGKFSDSEEETKKKQEFYNQTYIQQQQELKESFKKASQYNEDNKKQDLLLKPKIKTNLEIQKEENDYKEWLKGQVNDINMDEQKDFKSLRDFWSDPDLNENEKFLRDYVLYKKFLDKQLIDDGINYDHVIHGLCENLSEDEENINEQEEFEYKYNFRFEEPDQQFLKRYPRTLENSLRKKDNRRTQKRAEIKIRKKEEQIKKREEIKYLKALKKKEIEKKIEKIKEITGNNCLNLNLLDLEGDFDSDEYDKKMSKIFNEEYYTKQKDDIKPEFPDIDKELCIESTWDDYLPTNKKIVKQKVLYPESAQCEDPELDTNVEDNFHRNMQTEWTQFRKTKNYRRHSKFTEVILKEKPKYNPMEYASYKDYYDQYYALDYEDIIGDLPCRFKYRQVVPNDYGLSIEEILMADDKELNKWCSLKKALEYKSEYKELNDVKIYKQKGSNETLKRKILKSLYKFPKEKIETSNYCQNSSQQHNQRKYKSKMETQLKKKIKTEKNKNNNINIRIEESSKNDQNIKEVSKNDIELRKSMDDNNKKKYKLHDVLSKNDEKLTLKNNNMKNIKNEYFSQQRSMIEKKCSSNKNHDSVNKSKKIYKYNNINKDNTICIKEKNNQFKKSKNKINSNGIDEIALLSAERLKAYGLNPKKFKNKLKYKK